MEYKISQLVEKTKVPKSTILYYIREGLLPEAKKLKSNVHRYSDEHVERIKYIKYMKEHIGSSNEQIKYALQNRDTSLSSSSTMITPLMNMLSGISPDTEHYSKEAFLRKYPIDPQLLEILLEEEILMPLGDDDFTEQEAAIVALAEHFKTLGLDHAILKEYARHAKELSRLEYQMQTQLCDIRSDENFSTLWKVMFETLFNAKEYILKRQTYHMLLDTVKKEVLKKD